ncbi:hypothetical protein Taro_008079 [Colocasia esculenta]|uniref:Uncharacterized protein n=1 Tax=Colocasia esculenta TaxID=4460 RepID=A0A843TW30_COLES|nr:hypothetical protein [Colocasia esculenta]
MRSRIGHTDEPTVKLPEVVGAEGSKRRSSGDFVREDIVVGLSADVGAAGIVRRAREAKKRLSRIEPQLFIVP